MQMQIINMNVWRNYIYIYIKICTIIYLYTWQINLLVLDTFGLLIDRLKGQKAKHYLCTICVSLLRHASHSKIVVRIENYRVIKKLMIAVKPNAVINTVFEHLGDKVYSVINSIAITINKNNYSSIIKNHMFLFCCNNSVVQFERTCWTSWCLLCWHFHPMSLILRILQQPSCPH